MQVLELNTLFFDSVELLICIPHGLLSILQLLIDLLVLISIEIPSCSAPTNKLDVYFNLPT